jgi:hypothetical protein
MNNISFRSPFNCGGETPKTPMFGNANETPNFLPLLSDDTDRGPFPKETSSPTRNGSIVYGKFLPLLPLPEEDKFARTDNDTLAAISHKHPLAESKDNSDLPPTKRQKRNSFLLIIKQIFPASAQH